MSVYSCKVCGLRYDEWLGDTKNGVPPGVPFAEAPGASGSVSRCTLIAKKVCNKSEAHASNQ